MALVRREDGERAPRFGELLVDRGALLGRDRRAAHALLAGADEAGRERAGERDDFGLEVARDVHPLHVRLEDRE